MRFIDDMHVTELEKMTDDEISAQINLECAEAGIPLSEPPPVAPVQPNVQPDVTVYEIGNFIVAAPEDVTRIQQTLAACSVLELEYARHTPNYEKIINGRADVATATIKQVYSQAHYATVRAALETYASENSVYQKEKEAFDKIEKRRIEVIQRVRNTVNAARTRARERERIRLQMKEYEKLADGSAEIAYRFLRKAHPDVEERFPELFQGGWLKCAVINARETARETALQIDSAVSQTGAATPA